MGRPSKGLLPLSGADRQARLAERKRADGLRQVTVWVPEGTQAEVRAFADKLRTRGRGKAPSVRVAAPGTAATPPARSVSGFLLPTSVIQVRMCFPAKPPFALREALKAVGMVYQGDGVWTGCNQVQVLSPLMEQAREAGGDAEIVR